MNGPDYRNRSLESDIWLDRLEDLANHKAAASHSLADLEKAASTATLIAQARLSREELKHQLFRLRLDDARSIAFLAIPLLIFIALLLFISWPAQQAYAVRQNSEADQFHEVERTFIAQVTQTGALVRPDLLLLTAPLQPYLNNPRFQKEARDLSILALSHAASSDAFQDYLVSRNIRVDGQNLATFLTLDRVLYTNFNELDDALSSESASNISTIVGRPLTKEQGQRARDGILVELTFLSSRVAAFLRAYKEEPLHADLRRVYLKGVDLSGILFGKSNLDGCQWEGVTLNNADLSEITSFENSQWIDANWWDAKAIGKPLLQYLITNQYPYHPPLVDYVNAPASQSDYVSKVMRLCNSAKLASCDENNLPYGTPAKPKPVKPVHLPAAHPAEE